MAIWRTPVFDRTMDDAKSLDRTSAAYQKGALNADDLNRIEDNYKYLMAKLKSDAIFIPHRLRNFTETVMKYVEKENSILPEGYTRLECIESTGTQYIDTGFKPNQDTRLVMDVQPVSENASLAANEFFGARNSTSSKAFAVQWNTTNNQFQHFYNNGYTNLSFGDFAIRQIIDVNKNTLSINGVTNTRTYGSFQCDYSMYLCCLNNAGVASFFANIRVYSCKIYDNDVLIRDYIPVLDSNDVPCLYDKVGRKLYYNSGAGTFDYYIPVELPTGYTQVSYIQSSGTQYIDTGFSAPNGFVAEFGMAVTDTSNIFYVVGSHNLNSPYGRNYIACKSNTAWELGLGDSYPTYADDIPTNSMVRAKCSTVEGNSYLEVDGTRTTSSTDNSGRSAYNVWLFANQYDARRGVYSVGRLYSMKIYDVNLNLVRDMIPCTNASGTAGLYDRVNDVFYENAGTGEFIAGPEVEPEISYELAEVKTTYTDWQEHNLPWLSEINRIRANHNALARLFLVGLGFSEQAESNYLDYGDVNDWERIALVSKRMYENMEKEYRYCGMEESGGDRLL